MASIWKENVYHKVSRLVCIYKNRVGHWTRSLKLIRKQFLKSLLIDEKLESFVDLIVDVLGLATFGDQVVDDRIDSQVQLLNSLLAILGSEVKF